ncbi:MAG: motility-associated protein [Pseudomonadota bacterium]
MLQVAGLLLVAALVFGALLHTGGPVVAEALPIELTLIGGAALGVLMIANAPAIAADALSGFWRVFRGPSWKRADYQDLLVLLHGLMSDARRGGVLAIEADIEAPSKSRLFQAAPKTLADPAATDMICGAFRLAALGLSDRQRAEEGLERAAAAEFERRMKAVGALNAVADALPALGIVAAVIGIIRTMGAIDQAPSVVGAMIAAALLGTFIGVFLAYGVVGPIAARFGQIIETDAERLEAIRAALSAYLAGLAPSACVEIARNGLPEELRPDGDALSRAREAARFKAAA